MTIRGMSRAIARELRRRIDNDEVTPGLSTSLKTGSFLISYIDKIYVLSDCKPIHLTWFQAWLLKRSFEKYHLRHALKELFPPAKSENVTAENVVKANEAAKPKKPRKPRAKKTTDVAKQLPK